MWNNLAVNLTTASPHGSWFLVACAIGTVLLLLILIAKIRLHPALALATVRSVCGAGCLDRRTICS
jgi:hypothetical protein